MGNKALSPARWIFPGRKHIFPWPSAKASPSPLRGTLKQGQCFQDQPPEALLGVGPSSLPSPQKSAGVSLCFCLGQRMTNRENDRGSPQTPSEREVDSPKVSLQTKGTKKAGVLMFLPSSYPKCVWPRECPVSLTLQAGTGAGSPGGSASPIGLGLQALGKGWNQLAAGCLLLLRRCP